MRVTGRWAEIDRVLRLVPGEARERDAAYILIWTSIPAEEGGHDRGSSTVFGSTPGDKTARHSRRAQSAPSLMFHTCGQRRISGAHGLARSPRSGADRRVCGFSVFAFASFRDRLVGSTRLSARWI